MATVFAERLFRLSPGTVSFGTQGFDCADAEVRENLGQILRVFVAGYNVALKERDHALVVVRLESEFDAHHVGFAFEGAGMCYALFDLLAPWTKSRLRAFTDGAGRKHDYIATVGAGFAVARMPWGRMLLNGYLQSLESMRAWCVIDGYGFHQGIFHREWFTVEARKAPAAFPAHARQLFDSGVGRSFWWTLGASPTRIKRTIDRFPEARRAEMWCGVGVAASYAGGVEERVLWDLLEQSGAWRGEFLCGFPFSARMRQKGGNASPWTDRACAELLGMTAAEAADLIAAQVDWIVSDLEGRERELRERGYDLLRGRLRHALERHGSAQTRPVRAVGTRSLEGT